VNTRGGLSAGNSRDPSVSPAPTPIDRKSANEAYFSTLGEVVITSSPVCFLHNSLPFRPTHHAQNTSRPRKAGATLGLDPRPLRSPAPPTPILAFQAPPRPPSQTSNPTLARRSQKAGASSRRSSRPPRVPQTKRWCSPAWSAHAILRLEPWSISTLRAPLSSGGAQMIGAGGS
jgi:hypothetical protein